MRIKVGEVEALFRHPVESSCNVARHRNRSVRRAQCRNREASMHIRAQRLVNEAPGEVIHAVH